jgi:glucuronoxylan 4-O-methyltransferase
MIQLRPRMRRAIGRVATLLSARSSWRPAYSVMRRYTGIQMSVDELRTVVGVVRQRAPCNFLVFGLGKDSSLWSQANRGGRTVFIEDNPAWCAQIRRMAPPFEIHEVEYRTRVEDADVLLGTPESLRLDLGDIATAGWDIILIDAPEGWLPNKPGRMQPIGNASSLGRACADVFVHDCDRRIERMYCDHFFGNERLVRTVGRLRHYRLRGTDERPSHPSTP